MIREQQQDGGDGGRRRASEEETMEKSSTTCGCFPISCTRTYPTLCAFLQEIGSWVWHCHHFHHHHSTPWKHTTGAAAAAGRKKRRARRRRRREIQSHLQDQQQQHSTGLFLSACRVCGGDKWQFLGSSTICTQSARLFCEAHEEIDDGFFIIRLHHCSFFCNVFFYFFFTYWEFSASCVHHLRHVSRLDPGMFLQEKTAISLFRNLSTCLCLFAFVLWGERPDSELPSHNSLSCNQRESSSSWWVRQVEQDANAILSASSFALHMVLFVNTVNPSGEDKENRGSKDQFGTPCAAATR